MLEFQHITASYHMDFPILNDINLHIEDNAKVVLLGRNGAGKTTFANTIFGLVPNIHGEIIFNGQDILSFPIERLYSMGIAYFMQEAPVFPQMSVKENLIVAAGKTNAKIQNARRSELKELFPILQNGHSDSMLAGALSGGERTQLCLAMALYSKPSLLILDEPFAGLSPSNARLILDILNNYQLSNRATVLLIAQDRQMASNFCENHYVIREGAIINERST
jgi:branched-chain amino acid transport system ATP-binding protein